MAPMHYGAGSCKCDAFAEKGSFGTEAARSSPGNIQAQEGRHS